MLNIFTTDPITLEEAQKVFIENISINSVPFSKCELRTTPAENGTLTEYLWQGRSIASFTHDGQCVIEYTLDFNFFGMELPNTYHVKSARIGACDPESGEITDAREVE